MNVPDWPWTKRTSDAPTRREAEYAFSGRAAGESLEVRPLDAVDRDRFRERWAVEVRAGLLVDAYVSAGRAEDANAWLEQAAPEDPQLYPTLAELYGRSQRWTDAARAYEQALATASTSFDLRVRYASMLMNAGGAENTLKARTRLREAVKLRGTDERALYLLAQAERQTHELDAAESAARKLIAQNGKNPRGLIDSSTEPRAFT